MSTMKPSHYDRVFEILRDATFVFNGRDIPLAEVPPAMADFLIVSVLALGEAEGLSEQAALAIIERQLNMLNAWRNGTPPFRRSKNKYKH